MTDAADAALVAGGTSLFPRTPSTGPLRGRAPAGAGFTLWFTGLSGAGKTTIAELVRPELERRGLLVEWLDGDEVREHLSKGLGFSKADRDTNIDRIGWVASRLTRHGAAVIVSAISPYREARQKAREMVEQHGTFVGTPRELSDLDMRASGALSPLQGFMGSEDYERVVEDMHLANGLAWALPVCLAVDEAPGGDEVALADESGRPLAVLEVEEVYSYDREREAERCFRTTDENHPGVARLYRQKPHYLAGRVTVFERREPDFPELALDPAETRAAFAERGWKRVVGFQTRNPIHRAHEYLTKVALETVDGLLVHPLVGETKSDDVPAATRVECYRVLLDGYYPADRVVLSAFPAAMRYAGPREAIWHAICRKNYGCSHFIVGRDHAGVGTYYGTYDAQLVFDEFEPHELDIQPMFFGP